jgi:LPS export ABC transporter protein LptC
MPKECEFHANLELKCDIMNLMFVLRWAKLFYAIALLALISEMILVAPKPLGRRQKLAMKPLHKIISRGPHEADQAIKGMHLTESEAGLKLWELNSEAASEFKGKGELILEKIKTRFFGKSGIQFFVRGKNAQVDMDTKDMNIEGDVLTKTSNNYEMQSEAVNYDAGSKNLLSESPIRILGPKDKHGNRLRLQGIGMQAHVEDGKVQIIDDVRGDVTLENGANLQIKSKSVELSSVSKVAHFRGNVVIDVDTLRVTGPSAQFQYADDGDALSSLYVEGGIKVSDVDKFATSENVKVQFKEKSLVFKGRPRLVKDNDEVFGDEIIFLNGGKRVQVKGVKAQIDSSQLEKQQNE